MKDFYINSNSQEESYDYSNITSNYSNITSDHDDHIENILFIMDVLTYVIIGVGLPLTLVAIYALYSLVRNDHVAPIYVINLLISDLIQLCCLFVRVATSVVWIRYNIVVRIYLSALMASVCFMVCVALERYLVIACPLWYHFRRTIKISVVVCVLVWAFSLIYINILLSQIFTEILLIISGVFLLLPLPLFIFFLGGTLKALSATRVPSDEKRQIVGILVLVLLIYTLLFLPTIIYFLATRDVPNMLLSSMSSICVKLSPLADLTLYVFMRKGTIDKLLSSVCCCRMDSNDINISSVSMMTTFRQSASCRQRKKEREKGEKTEGEM